VRFVTGYQPRKTLRRKLRIPVCLSLETGEHIAVTHILDISKGGAKIKLARTVDLPLQFRLSLSERGGVQRLCRLVWRAADEIGVRFIQPEAARAAPNLGKV
jgi:hypothetical protein